MRTRHLSLLATAVASVPLMAAATVLPASAESQPPPIAVELITPRSTFLDSVSLKLAIKHEAHGNRIVRVDDPSRTAVARITVQPGARFPWHTHPGPVIVNVVQGELTFVEGDGCEERVYPAGSAFADSGGDVHSAYGSSDAPTTLIATFFRAPASGPLTVTEGVPVPACG